MFARKLLHGGPIQRHRLHDGPVDPHDARPGFFLLGDRLDHGRERLVDRSGDTECAALVDDVAVQVSNLRLPPGLPVVVHRRVDIANLLRPFHDALRHVRRQRHLQRRGHRRDLADDLTDDSHHLRMVERFRHLVVDQHRDRVKHAVPAHLLPLAPANVFRQLAGNPRCGEQIANLQQPPALMPHEFADGHGALLIVINDARGGNFRIDEGHAAHHAIPPEARDNPVLSVDTVLQREDDRPVRQHRLDLRHNFVEVIGLHGEDDEVRCGKLPGIRRGLRPHCKRAAGAPNRQPLLSNGCEGPGPQEKGDIGVILGQMGAEVSSDRSGSHHHDLLHAAPRWLRV